MKSKLLILAVFSAVVVMTACKKDTVVAPVEKVTYNKDVKHIFVSNCSPCHLAGGSNPNKWDDYTTAKNKISTILVRVNKDQGTQGFMPNGGTKLSADTIAVLDKWLADGLLEN